MMPVREGVLEYHDLMGFNVRNGWTKSYMRNAVRDVISISVLVIILTLGKLWVPDQR